MALCKERIDPNTGVVTNYHNICSATVRKNRLYAMISSYVSKDYRQNGESISTENYIFPITIEEEESMGIRKLAYKKIKELPEWEGAEDC